MRGHASDCDPSVADIYLPVTGGHQVYKSEIWFNVFADWLDGFLPPRKAPLLRAADGPKEVVRWLGEDGSHSRTNGAVPATGSDYFRCVFDQAFCCLKRS